VVYLVLAIGAVVFVICFKLLDVVPKLRAAVAVTREAHGIIRSDSLTDEFKEAAVQQAAVHMARSAVVLLARMGRCLLLGFAAIWVGAHVGPYTTADVLAAASDWMFITASSLVMLCALMMIR
jgi:hypothetical protein